MNKFLNELMQNGKIASITLKNNLTISVIAVDDDVYTLDNGEKMYIAPDQIAYITDGSPDPRLGF